MSKYALHVKTFQHWLDNFSLVSFDVEEEDLQATKQLLIKLINEEDIDQGEIELLYTLSLDNVTMQKSDFIKFQAKSIINFLNSAILTNVEKETL